jgi:hypothetical protein
VGRNLLNSTFSECFPTFYLNYRARPADTSTQLQAMSEGIAKRMCFNKKRYKDMIAAACASGRVAAIFGIDQRWYECPVCRGWHLTKKPRRE